MFRIRYRPTPKVVAGMNPTDGLPEIFRLHRFREDRVPGGAADPLPYPTGEPSCKDHIPRGGDGNDRGEDSGRDRTSEGKLPSSAQFVGKISREELYEVWMPRHSRLSMIPKAKPGAPRMIRNEGGGQLPTRTRDRQRNWQARRQQLSGSATRATSYQYIGQGYIVKAGDLPETSMLSGSAKTSG